NVVAQLAAFGLCLYQRRYRLSELLIESVCVSDDEPSQRAGFVGMRDRVMLHSVVGGFGTVLEKLRRHRAQVERSDERLRRLLNTYGRTLFLLLGGSFLLCVAFGVPGRGLCESSAARQQR